MQYVFGDYSLDPVHYELRQAGTLVPLEPRCLLWPTWSSIQAVP